jgi:alkylhydroperoxidase family enzyme
MRKVHLLVGVVVWCAGCAGPSIALDQQRAKSMVLPPEYHQPAATVAAAPAGAIDVRLATGMQNLKGLSAQLSDISHGMRDWWQHCAARKTGVFTSDETDRIEALLFQFLLRRELLWNMILLYGNSEQNFAGAENQTRALAIGYGAAALQSYYSSRLVLDFLDESKAIRKMNEIHYKYAIPAESFDSILAAVTAPDNMSAIRAAHRVLDEESRKKDSLLARLAAGDHDFKTLLEEADAWYAVATANTDRILKKKSLLLPDVANFLRRNKLVEQARAATRHISDNLYVAQGLLYNNVSDIKRPMTPPVDFNPDQVRLIKSLLQPGDVIFCFTAGYMSNVFLPGRFKHGITFVGTPEQRAAIGFTAAAIRDVPEPKRKKLAEDLQFAKLETGYDADVIEAVAEGVIFNSLDYLLRTHVNRLLVLRPRISADDRVQALGNTFLLLGSMYDFNFDFADTSYQCCTEVIYRALNKRGNIDFTLVPRVGVQTLAADDIIEYYLAAPQPVFDLILYAEENPSSPIHGASLFTGNTGLQKLKDLMIDKSPKLPFVKK